MKRSRASTKPLRELAQLYGIQTAYTDLHKRRKVASVDALVHTLKALGAPVDSPQDAPAALREKRLSAWRQRVEPITLAWEGKPPRVGLHLAKGDAERRMQCLLRLESGEERELVFDLGDVPIVDRFHDGNEAFVRKEIRLREKLPLGYHELQMGESWSTLILAAPKLAYAPVPRKKKQWGIFLPLYALHTERSWGAGDFSDLRSLVEWTAELGGDYVGTLPLSAAFLEEPFEPSPYSPVSRLFWNEIFIDPRRAPELQESPEGRALVESGELQREIDAVSGERLVDYRRLAALKRRVLEPLSRNFSETVDPSELQRFRQSQPVDDYACFRAAQERRPEPWPKWPRPLREGSVTPRDYDERSKQYHLYVQWTAQRQMQDLERKADRVNVGLYLDLPVGVHPHGYDVWRWQNLFALDAEVGAPPDPVFTTGQRWGFPPLHPETIRKDRYRYTVAYLRHQMRQARLLRIDHVMGLHRLFWIPDGIDARDGVYVSYRSDEHYALVNLESHRNRTGIVGENLGIVPAEVNRQMLRHGLYGMYVLQYSVAPKKTPPLRKVPRNAVGSLNTHDTPPFEGFLRGDDIEQQRSAAERDEVDLIDKTRARVRAVEALETLASDEAPDDGTGVLRGCLSYLASGPARVVLVSLEDLWRERASQNVPGYPGLNPNWRHKARLSFEEFSSSPRIRAILSLVHSLRQGKKK